MAKSWLGRLVERTVKSVRAFFGPTQVPDTEYPNTQAEEAPIEQVDPYPPYTGIDLTDPDEMPANENNELRYEGDVTIHSTQRRRTFETYSEAEAYAAEIPVPTEIFISVDGGFLVTVEYEVYG